MGHDVVLESFGLTKRFGLAEVLRGVDLAVHEGEKTCIIGPSGGGKTTLLRCFALLDGIDGGAIAYRGQLVGYSQKGKKHYPWNEKEAATYRSHIGMVFQHFNLFPNMTAAENVAFGLVKVRHEARERALVRARELLAGVGLEARADAYPIDLSGGQQQRVAIARALAMEPDVMLFDEPTSALDPELVGDVLETMRKLALAGMTMVVVTHEIEFARGVADRVVFMEAGAVEESGPPEKVLTEPQSERTRSFLRSFLSRSAAES
jgi:polar amino acid transport system ATP-binding protein